MFYEDEKLKNAYAQDDDYDDNDNDYAEQEEVSAKPAKKVQKRVTIEDPQEKSETHFSFANITILTAVIAIAICLFAKLLGMSGAMTAGVVFMWIAAAALIAGYAIYILQVVKTKEVKFDPQVVLLILASVLFA